MTRAASSAFPELHKVFSGYLHEDVLAEAGTPEAALRTFWADATPGERRRFQREVTRFLTHTAGLGLDDLRAFVHKLGSRWIPPSREALISVLAAASSFPEAPSR